MIFYEENASQDLAIKMFWTLMLQQPATHESN
jgi:hypothetical protein